MSTAPMSCVAHRCLADGMRTALGALYRLDEAGLTVHAISVRGSRPVIQIEPPPADTFLQGAMQRRTVTGLQRVTTMVASFHGATLEWPVRETRRQQVVRA